jgi:hypothetical protein
MRTLMLAAALAAVTAASGCAEPLCNTADCDNQLIVARNIAFAGEQPDNVTEGFDLDGIVSVGDDSTSCRQNDYVGPDGTPGIDNQFAVLWEAIVDVIGDAAEGLVLGAINDGNLLLMMEIAGIDDPLNDDCVDVNIFIGDGKPDVGNDGYITSGQTFDVADDSPYSHVECGTLVDGVLRAGPFDGTIRVSILDTRFDLDIFGAVISGELQPDGSMYATMGAGVLAEQIITVANEADYRLEGLVDTIVRNRADLARNEFGDCEQISATMLFDGTSGFLYEDAR